MRAMIFNTVGFICRVVHNVLLRNALTVFVFHDVSDKPSEFMRKYKLSVSPATFDYQIEFIKDNFRIISPDDLLESRIPKKAALITFDDGFRSCFTNAIPILERKHVPCVIFLNMGPIKGEIFWAGLITYLCEKRLDFVEYLRSRVVGKSGRRVLFLLCSEEIVYSYLEEVGQNFSDEVCEFVGGFAREEDIEEAAMKEVVFYGNHLFNHYIPVLMSDERLIRSFVKNREELEKYPNSRNLFSFPFGQPGSCFSERQVGLLIENGAKKVFRSSGTINYDATASYLDRIGLTSYHECSAKIWFEMFRSQLMYFVRKSRYNLLE